MACSDTTLKQEFLEPTRFTCNNNNLLEASVATDATLTGTGSTANPLSLVGGVFPSLCLEVTDTTPVPDPGPDERCLIVFEGHATFTNGLYIWNGNNWQSIVTW